MGLFGRKKKKRAKKPVLEPLAASVAPVAVAAPVAQVQPIVELASPPTNIQPDMVIEMDMDIQPAVAAAPPAVELAPAAQPAASAGQPADWHKRSEKPLMDIHRRLDSMLEEDSASLEERYRERFGDKLPKSVAGTAPAKQEEPAAEGKKITFKSRSGISFKPRAAAPAEAAEAEEEPAAAEAPAAEDTPPGDASPGIGSRLAGGARSAGSRTKGAIGSGASAVGRGARATGSAIGSGASKFAGLFRRGDSGDTKPVAKKPAAKKPAVKKAAAKKAAPKKRAAAKKKAKPDYGAMTSAQLKAELKKQGLPVSGRKAELVKRLQKA
jgi:hypothetical protein